MVDLLDEENGQFEGGITRNGLCKLSIVPENLVDHVDNWDSAVEVQNEGQVNKDTLVGLEGWPSSEFITDSLDVYITNPLEQNCSCPKISSNLRTRDMTQPSVY